MLTRLRGAVVRDDGSTLLLIFFYAFVAAAMIVIAIDVSKLFLARRALASVADAAALAAVQHVDKQAVYSGSGSGCDLPIDDAAARVAVDDYVAGAADGLRGTVTTLAAPEMTVHTDTVTVQLDADVHVPFDRIVSVLLRDRSPVVHLTVAAHARAPLIGACP